MKSEKYGLGIAAMVLGIVAVSIASVALIFPFFSFLLGEIFGSIALICGIVAIVMGNTARFYKPAGRAIAGFVLGIIAVSLSGILLSICIIVQCFF